MAKESPLQKVKRLYGSKDKLVDSVVDLAKGAGEEVSQVKDRLRSVSNQKLLHLAEVSKTMRDKYGSKDKLVDNLVKTVGAAKDQDYVNKLKNLSPARLLDMVKAANKRSEKATASK